MLRLIACLVCAALPLEVAAATLQQKQQQPEQRAAETDIPLTLLVAENFNDNRYAWFLFKDSVAQASFRDSTLTLRNFRAESFASALRPIAIDPSKDYRITMILRTPRDTSSGAFGVMWGSRNNFNYNVLWLRYGDSTTVQRTQKGVPQTTYRGTAAVPKEYAGSWLRVSLEHSHGNIAVSINGAEYSKFPAPKFVGQLIGIAAKGHITVSIDSMAVFQNRTPLNLVSNLPKLVYKESLDKSVNTPYVEKLPVITANGRTLWFNRAYHPKNYGIDRAEDIWYANIGENGKWETAINPGPPLNNEYSNSVISVTPDNNTLLLFGTYPDTKHVRAVSRYTKQAGQDSSAARWTEPTLRTGFFMTHRVANGWSAPTPVVIRNYYSHGDKISGCLSSDRKFLLISMEREDSYGFNDLYVCHALPDSTWSEPRNLGADINTFDDDSNPFLAADGLTMFFTTAARSGYGDRDIFITRRKDTTWQHWTEPQNFGPAINTPLMEASYTTTASGDFSYYVSKDTIYGSLDIYRLILPDSARPKPLALVMGKTINSKTGEPVAADIFYERVSDGKEVGRAQSNPDDGSYVIALPAGDRYGFRAEAEGYASVNDYFDLNDLRKYLEVNRDLTLVPIEKGAVIRLNNIFFDFGKWDIKPASFAELNRAVTFLKNYPEIMIEIAGHTDNIGTLERNLEVSANRAEAVADFLVRNGVSRGRIIAKGYGDSRPVAGNITDADRQKNRRVEFIVR